MRSSFLGGLCIGVCCWAGSWILLIAGQVGNRHPDNDWVYSAYQLKKAAVGRLDNREKILVVGGSASMFGVDSALLSTILGKPALNFGTNAGLGPHVIARSVDSEIHDGDVVLMPIEYRLLLWDGLPSYVTITWTLQYPQTFADWSLKTKLYALFSTPLSRVVEGYLMHPPVNLSGPYGAHRLNSLGDQTGSSSAERTDRQAERIRRVPEDDFVERYSQTVHGLRIWSAWWQKWRERGACVLVVPPPFHIEFSLSNDDYRSFFSEVPDRVSAYGVHYMGTPLDFIFSYDDMFDTSYHLASEARDTYTRKIADLVLEYRSICAMGKDA